MREKDGDGMRIAISESLLFSGYTVTRQQRDRRKRNFEDKHIHESGRQCRQNERSQAAKSTVFTAAPLVLSLHLPSLKRLRPVAVIVRRCMQSTPLQLLTTCFASESVSHNVDQRCSGQSVVIGLVRSHILPR
ncbi:hypothetical protein BHM03_00045127 [Ensete ventricosum]|nr:hypothetical protein BHM03_00045127 [Ensete ventricosum]